MNKVLAVGFILITNVVYSEDVYVPSYKEVLDGLYFRDTPQVIEGPDQNRNVFPHLDTLRRVDRVEEINGWVKVNLSYASQKNSLSDPIVSWIWHENYAKYVEPYFPHGAVRDVTTLKQIAPADPKNMHTTTVSLSDDFISDTIPTRDAERKKIPYWAPAGTHNNPLRLIYTVPDMKPRWVPREVVEKYNHVSRAKVDFGTSDGETLIKKGDHIVELSFDSEQASVYNLSDPSRVVIQMPVAALRSLKNAEPLKVDVSELESDSIRKDFENKDSLVAHVPAGVKQEFVNSKMTKVKYNGPLKLIKVADGKDRFSWATRVQVIDAKGKSLGNFYVSEKIFDKLQGQVSNDVVTQAPAEEETFKDNPAASSGVEPTPSAPSNEGGGHLGDIMNNFPREAGTFKVKYDYSGEYCGERAGKFAKYYYEEPRLEKRFLPLREEFLSAGNDSDLPPALLAAMVHIETKFNAELENTDEKNKVGGNESHKSNPSIWGKGIAQLGRAEGVVLNLKWRGTYADNKNTPDTVWHTQSAISGMAELVLKKVKEVSEIEKKHNELVAAGKRKHKLPEGTLIKFMLDRAAYQPPPELKPDGSNKKEIEEYHQIAYAEKLRYLTSMYNRGMRAPKAVLAYLERTGSFPGFYGQAWSEAPHATQSKDDVLMLQQINRGHVHRTAGLCGPVSAKGAVNKYADYNFDSSTGKWSVK